MTELEKQAFIEEYISLRGEINQRTQNQLYILGINMASFSTLFSLSGINFQNITLLLLVSIIYCIVAWIYIEQDIFLTQAAGYLNKVYRINLRNKILECSPNKDISINVMDWENYRNTVLFKIKRNRIFLRLMVLFRILAAFGPSIAIFVTFSYFLIVDPYMLSGMKSIDYFLFIINLIFILLLGYQYIIILKLYREIAN